LIQTIGIIILLFISSFQLKAQEVILLRHAKVFQDHSGWMGSKRASELRANYDTAPIHKFSADTVYVSKLPRSVASGVILFGDSATVVSMDVFNEFELHVNKLPLYMPYKAWTSLSRTFWLIGHKHQSVESYSEAKQRVKRAVDFIEAKTKIQEQVILVTHGFINRNIANTLKKRGWEITENKGSKNLGATILRRENSKITL
jgi:broad specificity phosphatase PhoE